jgi:hypothetical protein
MRTRTWPPTPPCSVNPEHAASRGRRSHVMPAFAQRDVADRGTPGGVPTRA